jgi:hypothetical protein
VVRTFFEPDKPNLQVEVESLANLIVMLMLRKKVDPRSPAPGASPRCNDVNHHSISTFSMFLSETSSLKIQTILVIGAAFCILLTFFRPFLVIVAACQVYRIFSLG